MGNLRLGIMVDAVDNASGKLNGIAGNVTGATKKMESGLGGLGAASEEARIKMAAMGSIAEQMGVGISIAGAAITGAMALTVRAAMRQEEAEDRLRVMYGRNADELIRYAGELQKQTRFSDQASMEAMTLGASFKNLKPYLKQATAAAANMAEVTGVDLKTAMGAIAQGSQGSIDALVGYGVELDEARVHTEGMGYVLRMVNEHFKNAAFETDNASVRYAKFKNALGTLAEEIGGALLPAVVALTPGLTSMAENFSKLANTPFGEFLITSTAALGLLLAGLGPVLIGVGRLATAFSALSSLSVALGGAGGLGAVIKGLVGVQGSAGLAAKGVTGLVPLLVATGPYLIAAAAIVALAYELWKLKGAYDDAAAAARQANKDFAASQAAEDRAVKLGYADPAVRAKQRAEVRDATPTLGERWSGAWRPGVTSKQLAQQREGIGQESAVFRTMENRRAQQQTVTSRMQRQSGGAPTVNVYIGDKPLEEKMYEVQERSARGAYGAVGL